MTGDTFRAPEVCELTGITYRQLDYWANTGLVRPSVAAAKGSGTQRLYSAVDVAVLRVITRIIQSGPRNNLELVRRLEPTIRDLVTRGERDAVLVITVDGDAVTADTTEQLVALVQLHQAAFVITGFDLPEVAQASSSTTSPSSTPDGGACAAPGEGLHLSRPAPSSPERGAGPLIAATAGI